MKSAREIQVIGAIAVGGVALGVSAINVFVDKPEGVPVLKWFASADQADLTNFVLGLLLVFVAVQTLDIWLPLEKKIDQLNASSPELFEGEAAIYVKASQVVAQATSQVRAATFRNVHESAQPAYWGALVERRKTHAFDFQLVYGFGDVDELRLASAAHESWLSKGGITVEQRYVPSPVGVDLLLVDSTTLLIALPVVKADPKVRRAICIVDAGVVQDVVHWFNNYLWDYSDQTRP